MSTSDVKKSPNSKMGKSLETLKVNLSKIRTGRAHAGILDHIHGRVLRLARAAQPGRQRHFAGRSHDQCAGLGKEDGRALSKKRFANPTSG